MMQKSGREDGHWIEYEETPDYHHKGYFWLRSDGLRFGLRLAGEYYREGTTPVPPNAPVCPGSHHGKSDPLSRTLARIAPKGAYADGAMAFDYSGSMREKAKRETLPTHLRVMRDGRELELIEEIDGKKIEELMRVSFNFMDFMDARHPLPSSRLKKVTTTAKKKVMKKKSDL